MHVFDFMAEDLLPPRRSQANIEARERVIVKGIEQLWTWTTDREFSGQNVMICL
jgi:hypothetical protein